jgi:hypothetical protein
MTCTLKVHWLFRTDSGAFAWCSIRAIGPVSDDPLLVTCKSCRRALERERAAASKEGER